MRFFLVTMLILSAIAGHGQPRKLPAFSFQQNSLLFADANRTYSSEGSFVQTDTLADSLILNTLVQILEQNPELLIEIRGHTAVNEEAILGRDRAELIKKMLVRRGIDPSRLNVVNYAHTKPLIKDEVLLSLPSSVEKEAANQKNRRVEIEVRGVRK